MNKESRSKRKKIKTSRPSRFGRPWDIRMWSIVIGIVLVLGVNLLFVHYKDVGTRILILAITVSLLITFIFYLALIVDRRISAMEELSSKLSDNPQLTKFYESTVLQLEEAYSNTDPIFQELLEQQLRESLAPLRLDWREWKLTYKGELWRNAYRQVLDQPDVREYDSIAWVKSEKYWHEPPGKESLRYNHELVRTKGKTVRRIFLVRSTVRKSRDVKRMISEDRDAGIKVQVAREEYVPDELKHDLGIYGERACGYQYTDDQSLTDHFDLIFDPEQIKIAKARFESLSRWSLTEEELNEYLAEDIDK